MEIAAVDKVTFDVGSGGIFGIVGPNGSGKTTLLRVLATLLSPSNGTAYMCGIPLNDLNRIRELLGIVLEDQGFYWQLSAFDYLTFLAKIHGVNNFQERILALAEFAGLKGRIQDKVYRYSYGMRKRLVLIGALLHNPKILLLDEPSAGLDMFAANSFRDFIRRTSRELGMTTILATHDIEQAAYLCDQVSIMCRGKMIASLFAESFQDTRTFRQKIESTYVELVKRENEP